MSTRTRTGCDLMKARNLSIAAPTSLGSCAWLGIKSAMALPRLVIVKRFPAWTWRSSSGSLVLRLVGAYFVFIPWPSY